MKFLGALLIVTITSFTSCIVPESTHVEPTYHLLTESVFDINRTSLSKINFNDSNDSLLKNTFYLRQVELPSYLIENKLIERVSHGEVLFRENHRWGEPIDEGVCRVLSLNLSRELKSPFYSAFPHRKKMGSYIEISVRLNRFEKVSDSVVLLRGSWQLFVNDFESGQIPIVSGNETIEINIEQNKLVKNEVLALSDSLSSFAKVISQSVFSLIDN